MLSSLVFCLTGALSSGKTRATKEAEIRAAGGQIAKSVTKACTHLLVADKQATSKKIKTARSKGVQIVDEETLDRMIAGGVGKQNHGKKRNSDKLSSVTTKPKAKRPRANTKQTPHYLLVLQDGTTTVDESIAALSQVLASMEPSEVPLTEFSVSTAQALLKVIGDQSSRDLSPEYFAHVLQLSDFLGIDSVCKIMLEELDISDVSDPLARLRASYASVPSFSTMLQQWLQIDSKQELQQLLDKLVSSHDPSTAASCLTYRELDLCDGQHFGDVWFVHWNRFRNLLIKVEESEDEEEEKDEDEEEDEEEEEEEEEEPITPVRWGHLRLSTFGAQERAKRALLIEHQTARTKELRKELPTKGSAEKRALEVEFTEAIFAGDQVKISVLLEVVNFVPSKRVLPLKYPILLMAKLRQSAIFFNKLINRCHTHFQKSTRARCLFPFVH